MGKIRCFRSYQNVFEFNVPDSKIYINSKYILVFKNTASDIVPEQGSFSCYQSDVTISWDWVGPVHSQNCLELIPGSEQCFAKMSEST